MKKPVLLIMAAGMGSRYGGLKQIDPVGPAGQIILDYSVYDAHRAGFERVVFIIRPELQEAFEQAIGRKARRLMQVDYVYQTLDYCACSASCSNWLISPTLCAVRIWLNRLSACGYCRRK